MPKCLQAATEAREGPGHAREAVITGAVAIMLIAWYGAPASAVAEQSFSISGSVAGLAPGIPTALPVTLGNPSAQPITVSQVRVTAADASAGCPASNFVSQEVGGPMVIPGHGQSQQALPVILASNAPTACQGASFPLTFSGVARATHPHHSTHRDTFAFMGGSTRAAAGAATIAVLGAVLTVLARRRRAGGMRRAPA